MKKPDTYISIGKQPGRKAPTLFIDTPRGTAKLILTEKEAADMALRLKIPVHR